MEPGPFSFASSRVNSLASSQYAFRYFILAALVICAGLGNMVVNALWKDVYFINRPVHIALEAVGATIALFVASILRSRRKNGECGRKFFLLSMGFLVMGLFDIFRSVAGQGNGAILLRSASYLTGSLWFATTWLPALASDGCPRWKRAAPWVLTGFAVLGSISAMAFGKTLPAIYGGVQFSTYAAVISALAGVLFLASFVRLIIDFQRSRRNEMFVFAGVSLVFGLTVLTSPFRALWDVNWWLAHIYRLMAYVLVFAYVVHDHRQTEDALSESEKNLHGITFSTEEGIIRLDTDAVQTFVNPAAAGMLGYSVDELVGKPSHSTWHHTKADGSPYAQDDCPICATLKDGAVHINGDDVFRRKDNTAFNVAYTGTPIIDDGKITGVVLIFRDITEMKRAAEALQRAHDELERHVEERTLELSNLNEQLRTEIELRKRMEEALQKSFDELEENVKERTAELTAANAHLVDEVSRRKNAEKKLRISHERLHDLAAHLHSVREEERTLIAREIHDELGQSLTALKMDMSWMEGESAKINGFLCEKMKADLEMLNSIIQTVKTICTELRPGILDHLGLGPALEWQAQEFQKRSEIECRVYLDTEDINFSTDMETALFRIAQESLTNVLRHANATKVELSLTETNGNIILEIADNGVGITEEQLSKPNSFGLLGMRERMYPWKGEVTIKGTPNRGTVITVVVPSVQLF